MNSIEFLKLELIMRSFSFICLVIFLSSSSWADPLGNLVNSISPEIDSRNGLVHISAIQRAIQPIPAAGWGDHGHGHGCKNEGKKLINQ